VVGLLFFPVAFAIVLLQLVWLLRARRVDVVNVHYAIDKFVYFAICRRLLSIKLVTSIHGGDAFAQGRPKPRYSRAFTFLLQSSDLIILPSDAYRRLLLEAFPHLHHKTRFIHNGVDPVRFSSGQLMRNDRHAQRYILCVAHLKAYKGIDVLLRAFKRLSSADDSVRLVLAGDGPLRVELEELASSLGIADRVEFRGTQTASEVPTLLRGCELLVLPSREEAFGIVLIEAMACKTPVVASAVGGIPEVIEHEVTGILVEPDDPDRLADALARVLTDTALKRTIAENGYARMLDRFSSSHSGAAYLNAFASVLQCGHASVSPKVPATGL
jgi:glycosyltransferase involved in cell wall biosynthesis